jgi:hypothetical protein
VIAIVGAIWLSEPWLRRLSRILDRVAVVLLIVVLILIVPEQASSAAAAYRPPTGPGTATAAQRPLRDVYYLILDRYGSDRSLELRFGVRNDLTPWLTANGFRVLPDSHANYVKTTLSMASTLNMTHLADLAAQVGTDSPDYGPIFGMLKDSRVARQFKALGYQYLHIGSYYSPTQIDPAADRNLYPSGPSDFEAVLYATTAIPVILRKLHLNTAKPVLERFYASGLFDWRALDSVRDAPGPKFVFGHFIIPHPPFVFGRDGQFVDPAADPSLKEADRLTAQLGWTNDQLKRWITSMLALPEDQRPIIIIQADEGPYTVAFGRNTATYDWSKATPDELEMKYGILNAWYLPDGTDPGLYDSMTSVNTFPVLFSGYFGLDIPKLEDREFTSANKNRPYDLTDITERLAAASR